MKKEKKNLAICYIHKVAMKEIVHEEPIPTVGMYKFKEYKCPMCANLYQEEDLQNGCS